MCSNFFPSLKCKKILTPKIDRKKLFFPIKWLRCFIPPMKWTPLERADVYKVTWIGRGMKRGKEVGTDEQKTGQTTRQENGKHIEETANDKMRRRRNWSTYEKGQAYKSMSIGNEQEKKTRTEEEKGIWRDWQIEVAEGGSHAVMDRESPTLSASFASQTGLHFVINRLSLKPIQILLCPSDIEHTLPARSKGPINTSLFPSRQSNLLWPTATFSTSNWSFYNYYGCNGLLELPSRSIETICKRLLL